MERSLLNKTHYSRLARLWLRGHEKLQNLRDMLGRMRFAAQTSPRMTGKMLRLMRDIAAEEELERPILLAIAAAEKHHRRARLLKRLRRLCPQPMLQPQPCRRDDRRHGLLEGLMLGWLIASWTRKQPDPAAIPR